MQADPSALRRLLDLQRIDTAISQLEHRAKTLPEHEQLRQHQATRTSLGQELVAAETAVSDATTAQQRAESGLEPVRARLRRDQAMVDAGTVTDPKVLRSMLDEIEHLVSRIATLEDTELERWPRCRLRWLSNGAAESSWSRSCRRRWLTCTRRFGPAWVVPAPPS